LNSLESVRTFQVKLLAYGTVLDTHKKREAVFSPNSQLYREIIQNNFVVIDLVHFNEHRKAKGWHASPEGLLRWLDFRQSTLEAADSGMAGLPGKSKPREDQLNTVFTTTTKMLEASTEDILLTRAIDEESHFKVYEDTPVEMVQQMLNIAH
jgi:hypothetical protein